MTEAYKKKLIGLAKAIMEKHGRLMLESNSNDRKTICFHADLVYLVGYILALKESED